jgi:hypothetical protein
MKFFGNIFRSFTSKLNIFSNNNFDPYYGVAHQNYGHKTLNEIGETFKSSLRTVEAATKVIHATGKTGLQTLATVALFDYVVGELITAKALWGTTISIFNLADVRKPLIDKTYTLISSYPSKSLEVSIATTFLLNYENLNSLILNTSKLGYYSTKTLYHSLNTVVSFAGYCTKKIKYELYDAKAVEYTQKLTIKHDDEFDAWVIGNNETKENISPIREKINYHNLSDDFSYLDDLDQLLGEFEDCAAPSV